MGNPTEQYRKVPLKSSHQSNHFVPSK